MSKRTRLADAIGAVIVPIDLDFYWQDVVGIDCSATDFGTREMAVADAARNGRVIVESDTCMRCAETFPVSALTSTQNGETVCAPCFEY